MNAIATGFCDVCQRDVPEHDIVIDDCICRDCWLDRPCEVCGGHNTKAHVRGYEVNGDGCTWCELNEANPDADELMAAVEALDVGETLRWGGGAAAETMIKRTR